MTLSIAPSAFLDVMFISAPSRFIFVLSVYLEKSVYLCEMLRVVRRVRFLRVERLEENLLSATPSRCLDEVDATLPQPYRASTTIFLSVWGKPRIPKPDLFPICSPICSPEQALALFACSDFVVLVHIIARDLSGDNVSIIA